MRPPLIAMLVLLSAPLILHASETPLALSELRESIGRWQVETRVFDAAGHLAETIKGTYEFKWVIKDTVATGVSSTAIGPQAALLFFINKRDGLAEMISVGADGFPWRLTGALDSATRYSQSFDTGTGSAGQMRFTRTSEGPNRFESVMEVTADGGKTWRRQNRQWFRRESQK